MSKIYFFIPSDIYIRDFDSRLLLAISIMNETKNINFIIGSQYQVNNFILKNKNIKKMIYLEKGIDMRYSNWYYYLANRGCLIYTLSEEGGKSKLTTAFELNLTNSEIILKILSSKVLPHLGIPTINKYRLLSFTFSKFKF